MATKPRAWPSNAEWARMDCLALSRKGRQALIDTLDLTDNPVMLRGMAKAIEAFREIESKLIAVREKEQG